MTDVEVRATDTLANERTFLAYVRTALAFVGFGFVIARFALFAREISIVAHVRVPQSGSSKALGVAMVLAGVSVALVGGMRYAETDRALRQGRNRALSPVVAYVGTALIAVIGVVVALDLFRF
jgi:putative membrane protein